MMPLAFCAIGEEHTILWIGGDPDIKRRLEDLGFVAGAGITPVSCLSGNVIVRIKDARIAISAEMAHKITVKPYHYKGGPHHDGSESSQGR